MNKTTCRLQTTDSLVLEIAKRMSNPETVKAYVLDPANANPDPMMPGFGYWDDFSLSGGYSGLLLLFATLQQKGILSSEDEKIVHQYVLKLKEALETTYLPGLSLFSGICGMCFALQQASMGGRRYQRMLDTLEKMLCDEVGKIYLEPIKANILEQKSSSSALHDAIQGISGIGRYAIENLSQERFVKMAQEIASTLVALCRPLNIEGHSAHGWYLSSTDILNANYKNQSPKGNFNLGLAHGVPGILAFLSLASLQGITVEGQADTITAISNWIRRKAILNKSMIQWPSIVSWEEEILYQPQKENPCRDAWCYGVPGVARSLFLAGKAKGDPELKAFAASAFRQIFLRTQEEWQIPGPGLCHGIAGLLAVTCEMAREPECSDLQSNVETLHQILLTYYNPEHPFGFQDVEPCLSGGYALVNKPGFLEGSTGVLLTLLTVKDTQSRWHLPLLI